MRPIAVLCTSVFSVLLLAGCAASPASASREEPFACSYGDLRNANRAGRDLRNANLAGADLTDASLRGANLAGAAVIAANLTGADLRDAVLSGTTDSRAPKRATSGEARYFCGAKDTTGLTNVRYVATNGTDSATCGKTLQSPCATIDRGIFNCTGGDCAVLVAFGEYQLSASLLLAGGVSIYGGCEMLEKPEDPPLFSLIRGAEGVPAVTAKLIIAPTTFQGFHVIAGAGRPVIGQMASIAFASLLSSGLSLQSVDLTAGAAAQAPADGQRGPSPPQPGESARAPNEPGRSPGGVSDGGKGAKFGEDGEDGKPGYTSRPGPTPGAKKNTFPGFGENGFNGKCGDNGKYSRDQTGYIGSDFTWMPSAGGDGGTGGPGAGGGGGTGVYFQFKGVGGAGGAGGAGGTGGQGGVQGGASIGLLIVGGQLFYTGGAIQSGAGARGRNGGGGALTGARGGAGGAGLIGGGGGQGGEGAPGSGAAGGNGGSSFTVATTGSKSNGEGDFFPTSVLFYLGTAGAPGEGGDGGPPNRPCTGGERGAGGLVARNQRLELREENR